MARRSPDRAWPSAANRPYNRSHKRIPNCVRVSFFPLIFEPRLLDLTLRADPAGNGPGSITLVDPDGNPLLIDQFF